MLPPFTRKLAQVPFGLDLPYWVEDPDFDLDFHVREIGLAPPGDDHQLADQVARIVARPLDRARPLWEIYLIRGLKGGRDALLTKIHHSAVDGVSGNEILAILLDLSAEGREVPPPLREPAGEGMPSDLSLLGRGLLGLPRQAMRAATAAPTAIRHIDALPWVSAIPGVRMARRAGNRLATLLPGPLGDDDLLEAPAGRAPRTRFSGPISAHRRLAIGSLPLDTIKAIKNELGVTVNDVVVALCASMMRAWLGRARRAARRSADRDGPGVGAHRGADGRVRKSHLGDVRPDPDRRARRPPPDRAHPRGAAGRQGASPGHARRASCRTPASSSRRR